MSAFLDHNATTPIDARVVEAMMPYMSEVYGNPSSVHRQGRVARGAIEHAREQVAALVGASPNKVVFTSGGTEANNTLFKGFAWRGDRGRVAVSGIEHPSVLDPATALRRLGWEADRIAVGADGRVDPESVRRVLRDDTRLVSVMLANNETGVIQDVAGISKRVRESGAWLHTDAIQAAGKIPVDFTALGVHAMTLSAHKIHGPKGVGALVIDNEMPWEPLLHGGGQEKGRRGGTENLAGIVGFGAAAELAVAELQQRQGRMRALRDRLERRMAERLPEAVIFARDSERLPNTLFMVLPGIDGETLLMNLDRLGFAVSSGAACSAAVREPSHVLLAMGIAPEAARGAVRISLGRDNTEVEVDAFVDALCAQRDVLRASAWNDIRP